VTRVLVMGGIDADLVARTAHLPERGQTLRATSFNEVPGGKGANVACAAVAWGATVSFLGRVGADTHGDAQLRALADAGVEVELVQRDAEGTGLGLVVMDASGEHQTVVVPRANDRLDAGDVAAIPEEVWRSSSAVALTLEAPEPFTVTAARAAAERRLPVILNASPAEGMPEALWSAVTHLVVNEHEAGVLLGHAVHDFRDAKLAAVELLERLAADHDHSATVTLGASGAVWAHTSGGVGHAVAPQVRVVDTLGAGDTFVGVFTAELADGSSVSAAATVACRAGAVAVTRSGTRAAVRQEEAAGV
jgi:ribokinase